MTYEVEPLAGNAPHIPGGPCVVRDGDGRRFWCCRPARTSIVPWDALVVYEWLEDGWDTVSPIRNPTLLKRLHETLSEAGI